MRPGDQFHIVNNKKISFDEITFVQLYLPIIGKTAFTLYQLLRISTAGKFSTIMEYLNVGMNDLEEALDKLMGLSLLRMYDNHTCFDLELRSPLAYEVFLNDDFYVHLLISRIGSESVSKLQSPQPQGQEISKKFSDIFLVSDSIPKQRVENIVPSYGRLDLKSFKKMMNKQGLSFVNEEVDIMQLYSLSDKFSLDWYALFKLTEETMNADKTINTSAITRKLINVNEPDQSVPEAYVELIRAAKSVSPNEFLLQIKRQVGGFVSADELKLLSNLEKQKMLPEVQNILIHYVLIQQGNASLVATLVNRVANDWLRHKVTTAELAIKRLTEFNISIKSGPRKKLTKVIKAVPKWVASDERRPMTDEERINFDKLRHEALKEM